MVVHLFNGSASVTLGVLAVDIPLFGRLHLDGVLCHILFRGMLVGLGEDVWLRSGPHGC